MTELDKAIEELREKLPAMFPGKKLDTLAGYNWRTLQNEKSRGEVPPEVFARSGKRNLLVVRDPFLKYWASKIRRA